MEKTIEAAKKLNQSVGQFWFSDGAMKFFKTKIKSCIIDGQYFITSELGPHQTKRRYTVRSVDWDSGSIDSVSDFQAFSSYDAARNFISKLG